MKEYLNSLEKCHGFAGRHALNVIRHISGWYAESDRAYCLKEDGDGLIEVRKTIHCHNSGGSYMLEPINSLLVYYDEERGAWKMEHKDSIISAAAQLIFHAVPKMPAVWHYCW